MIAKIWHGWTTPELADTYEQLLKTEIFPGIASRKTQGYRGIQLLRRSYKEETEFITMMLLIRWKLLKDLPGMNMKKRMYFQKPGKYCVDSTNIPSIMRSVKS